MSVVRAVDFGEDAEEVKPWFKPIPDDLTSDPSLNNRNRGLTRGLSRLGYELGYHHH